MKTSEPLLAKGLTPHLHGLGGLAKGPVKGNLESEGLSLFLTSLCQQ